MRIKDNLKKQPNNRPQRRSNKNKIPDNGIRIRDVPEIVEKFDPGLNPGLSLKTCVESGAYLHYYDNAGNIRKERLRDIYKRGIQGKEMFDNAPAEDYAITDAEFRKRVIQELTRRDVRILKRNSACHVAIWDDDGNVQKIKVYEFFPHCEDKYLIPGVNDCMSVDPSLAAYFDDPEMKPETTYALGTRTYIHFRCPYCGYRFATTIDKVLHKLRKCPCCEGITPFLQKRSDLRPGVYLVATRDKDDFLKFT